jgi:hypothetical protein
MSYRQMLDDAIGEVPPSTIEVVGIIGRQRRRMAMQRMAIGGGTAAVAVVLVTAWIHGSGGTRGSSPAASSCTPGPAASSGTPGSVAALRRHLDQTLWTDLSTAAPDLSWVTTSDPVRCLKTHPTAQDWMSQWTSDGVDRIYLAQGTVSSQGRIGTILFNINIDHDRSGPACPPASSDAANDGTCTITAGPHGEAVQTEVYHYALSNPAQIEIIVNVYRPDGVRILAENRNQSGPSENDGATGQEPPLTTAQLTQIAEDPALTLPAGWN